MTNQKGRQAPLLVGSGKRLFSGTRLGEGCNKGQIWTNSLKINPQPVK
jgi:hypothetical protein